MALAHARVRPTHAHARSCPAPHARARSGTTKDTRGTAYVAYEDIYDAKQACDHLSGFNVANRYLIVLYYNPQRINKKVRRAAGARVRACVLR